MTTTDPIDKLSNILRVEAERYQDRAVFGGLARYADTWLKDASAVFGTDACDWIEAVAARLRSYSEITDAQARRQAIEALLKTLEDKTAPPAQAHRQAAPPRHDPSPAPPPREAATEPAAERNGLDSPITTLVGVGPRQATRLGRLGIETIRDLLYFFPRHHDDYTQLRPINRLEYGEEVTIMAQVWDAGARKTRSGGSVFRATLSDGTGTMEATWFNQPFLADRIQAGNQVVISGKVGEYLGRLCFNSPEWELLDEELLHTARLVPIYSLTRGVGAKWLRRLIKRTVDYWSGQLPDHLPAAVCQEENLIDLETAITQIHFPDSTDSLEKARRRLAFDELFVLQIGLLRRRHLWRSEPGTPLPVEDAALSSFVDSLPYKLTGAQQKALKQITADLRSSQPMNRLLQGDVGSGKTVVATAAMVAATAAGAQAALMAPTEILAEQHHRTITRLLDEAPNAETAIRLLTSSVTGQEREEVYAGLADGSVSIIIGTHALIQEGVQFKNLVLAVIDEQHRFGVRQRAALRDKGYNPHLLVMSATPIPRSLVLTVWGHLDVSTVNEMPPGRASVGTHLFLPAERERAYEYVRTQARQGRQAFIICPLVEESDKIEAKAAVEEHRRLQDEIFPDLRLGLLHGRMKSEEKETTMASFARGELDVLVATSVVEVGIDVPNATVMLIEGADRFGLAQLHQFRGRVGRGEHDSHCLLISTTSDQKAQERLQAVVATDDGFELAQKDLELRGPGEFLGTRQSGLPDLKLVDVADLQLIEAAREAARRFFTTDPELAHTDSRLLSERVAQLWKTGEIS